MAYKCEKCDYESETAGEHCGQAMKEKQEGGAEATPQS